MEDKDKEPQQPPEMAGETTTGKPITPEKPPANADDWKSFKFTNDGWSTGEQKLARDKWVDEIFARNSMENPDATSKEMVETWLEYTFYRWGFHNTTVLQYLDQIKWTFGKLNEMVAHYKNEGDWCGPGYPSLSPEDKAIVHEAWLDKWWTTTSESGDPPNGTSQLFERCINGLMSKHANDLCPAYQVKLKIDECTDVDKLIALEQSLESHLQEGGGGP